MDGSGLFSFNHCTSVTSKSLSPVIQKLIFCFNLTSQPSVREYAHMLLGPHAGLEGMERLGVCWRAWLMPGSNREQEKDCTNCLVFVMGFLFCLERNFSLTRQSESIFNAFIVFSLMCTHLCLWTVSKTEISICYQLHPRTQTASERKHWESKEKSPRYAGSLERHCQA